ncbi:uncharacterized protein FIBRA_09510 [Fibroporia radiculosa]|uniref:Alcohol dehydrogenase-like N-terminal domain-containing protein n=1 Tax=Fibroporia radiculosa TaxID=599839 RepID=J7SCH8_9APHY|nr:uncharacterized protein FIBRA_09510 [Fibroporia radiculosa]CCM07171.1 predicted protein [Fibroporia radiculosa]
MSAPKALYLTTAKGAFTVGVAPIRKPGPGKLLVKIHATALNPADWIRHALDIMIDKYPTILGEDLSGTVEELGEGVTNFEVGDRVITEATFNVSEGASFQQYALATANLTAKVRRYSRLALLSFEEAASIPLGITTAAIGLYSKVGGAGLFPPWEEGGRGLYRGKPIVVFGVASSVGQFGVW